MRNVAIIINRIRRSLYTSCRSRQSSFQYNENNVHKVDDELADNYWIDSYDSYDEDFDQVFT